MHEFLECTVFYVYILFSVRTRQYYVGSTKEVKNRLYQHNAGKSVSARSGIPWGLVHVECFQTRSEAIHHEQKIKARGIGRYLADLGSIRLNKRVAPMAPSPRQIR
jgi:putative endonuclease